MEVTSGMEPLLLLVILSTVLIFIFLKEYSKLSPKFAINIKDVNPNIIRLINSTEIDSDFYENEVAINLIDSKSVPEDATGFVEVPAELNTYQHLLKPVRLGILSLLNSYTTYVSAEIRELLDVSWGKYTSHLNALEKQNLVITETEFVDNNPRKVISITSEGITEYTALTGLLREMMANS